MLVRYVEGAYRVGYRLGRYPFCLQTPTLVRYPPEDLPGCHLLAAWQWPPSQLLAAAVL